MLLALGQFHEQSASKTANWNSKFYSNFYLPRSLDYFLQGDLLSGIRQPNYSLETDEFEKLYANAIILSNTCDMDLNNERIVPKEIVFAPLTSFDSFMEELRLLLGDEKRLETIVRGIKGQTYSNVFYLPAVPGTQSDYVCFFDNAFWFPTDELNSYLLDLAQTRIASLDYFGYYLFLVKLSYHFCRLPEEKQR